MIRRAFTMRLKPGGLAEYKRNHDDDLAGAGRRDRGQGIAQITIFERDPVLFLYSEIRDEEAWDRLWHTAIHDQWGEIMNPLMEFSDDGIVDSSELREVFHLETARMTQGEVDRWLTSRAASRSSRVAAAGLGRGVAVALAARGPPVVAVARNADQLAETARPHPRRPAAGWWPARRCRGSRPPSAAMADVRARRSSGAPRSWSTRPGVFGPIALIRDSDPADWVETDR